ncbi:polysaccharide biosynthesis/export family protein [Flavobacterium sp. SUN052]|uniref:polysaccharide biosynthesis/export family protein n=1 Tax=Flavobacterium sp. SUN052 TaxID=3002441 RepID=UPI00237E47F5|nr:polysaccharide biosynthesis/export family protein [Flavobacterium sp. SUN052]MEC4004444.1 polysaccharide biosynthesis/export family protein [Flavobacterium sp. SUN052]
MNTRILYILFLIGILFTSCVPTQDLIYLQDKGNQNKEVVNQSNLKPYRLQTNDILSVSIKALDDRLVEMFSNTNKSVLTPTAESLYFTGYTVDDHGNIRIPVLGEINVLGFTLEETRMKIETQLLSDYFKKEAQIYVNVKLAGFRYTVNGEVTNPGSKFLYQDKVNILEAIANSGDITVTGDRKDVKVIRQFPQGAETFSIDLTDINAMKSNVYNLQPNDYIYIKPLKQKTWGTGKTGIESLGTIITILSLATTTFLLLK